MLAWLVMFVDGLGPVHDRRFGSILPDIRQNTPKTAITDGQTGAPAASAVRICATTRHWPLDQVVPRVPQHRSADQRNHVPPAPVTAKPLSAPTPGPNRPAA